MKQFFRRFIKQPASRIGQGAPTYFYFYFSEDLKIKARELALYFEQAGFETDVHQLSVDVNPQQDWSLVIHKQLMFDNLKQLHKLEDTYEELAVQYGGVYDGHDVPVNS